MSVIEFTLGGWAVYYLLKELLIALGLLVPGSHVSRRKW
jgi:hypothetical protein